MSTYSSDSDDQPAHPAKIFGQHRPLHAILGGGKVADILLWRDKHLSAATLIGFTVIWFLFEVAEYNFITLLCHTIILLMLALFVWSNGAPIINRNPPNAHEIKLSESTCRYVITRINWFLTKLYNISSGKDMKHFFVIVACLWMLSVIGNYVSSMNLIYLVFLCLEIVPAFYDRYENEVDNIATKGNKDVKKLYKKFGSKVLNKIPRGPVKGHR